MSGIVGYGAWIPFLRIDVKTIWEVWGNKSWGQIQACSLTERAVLQPSEDSLTLAVGAAKRAMEHAAKSGKLEIGATYFGSCTNPYDTRGAVAIVEDALGLEGDMYSADVQFGGKSGTSAMQIGHAMVKSDMVKQALCVGADTINRHSEPGRFSEYAASAAGVAVIIGEDNTIADIIATKSYSSELADFFRLEGERYISDQGNGGKPYPCMEIGYIEHMQKAAELLMKDQIMAPGDFDYVVFQQPNGKLPYIIGERLGFTEEQIKPGVIANEIGDCGSASALLGLANVLDHAVSGNKILLVSYGFGAGADAFILKTTDLLQKQKPQYTIRQLLDNKSLVDYPKAIRYEYKYAQEPGPLYL